MLIVVLIGVSRVLIGISSGVNCVSRVLIVLVVVLIVLVWC